MGGKSRTVDAEAPPAPEVETALSLLRRHAVERPRSVDGIATAVMDLYRRTGTDEAFEALIALCHDQLLRRVRSRTRFMGERVDADELLQDAFINIYRYPDRFDASRPGAFKAWSSTIVDNAVRRHLRRSLTGPDIRLRPIELLAQEPDRQHCEPAAQAIETESLERATSAFRLFLALYLTAYQSLSERERFVLQMVEVKDMRYAQLAGILDLRPEALKMVVFRARKRIFNRVSAILGKGDEPKRETRGANVRHLRRRPLSAAV